MKDNDEKEYKDATSSWHKFRVYMAKSVVTEMLLAIATYIVAGAFLHFIMF